MANKIVSFSPKIEIINHFDELINRVDIEFDECLEKYNENQVLGDLDCFNSCKRNTKKVNGFNTITVNYDWDEQQIDDLWSKSTKVVDYLKEIRMRTIEELRKAQEETLEYYKLNSSLFKTEEIKDDNKIEEFRFKLFGEKFYFQVRYTRVNKPWVFNLFTFVTDFYMSQSDINLLELIINNYIDDIKSQILETKPIFDEKMVLISLLDRHFLHILEDEDYPNHVIYVSKRYILNIRSINIPYIMRGIKLTCSSIDLSKLIQLNEPEVEDYLDEVELDGISSITDLDLYVNSLERFSARNLKTLNELTLTFTGLMDEIDSTRIFEQLPSISLLRMKGCFSNMNLDSLVNLGKLSIRGEINEDFNFGLLKNLCNHLKEISTYLKFDNDQISKLFEGHYFPCFLTLNLKSSKITKLETKLLQGFPMIQTLNIAYNQELRSIDYDAFSSLNNLVHLKLNGNCIEKIDQKHFSSLINLEILNLSCNQIKFLEENLFSVLTKLKNLNLANNLIESIEENAFSNLKNLGELDLSYNSLSTLNPQSFLDLGSLTNTELGTIDSDAFSSLSNLDYLELNKNSIEKLTNRTFSALIQLKTLNLNHNQIESIDKNTFSNLKNLTKLDLSYNRLSRLSPKSFFGQGNLVNLNLNNNCIEKLDNITFSALINLEILNLSYNQIKSLEDNIFSSLKNLMELDLSNNLLSTLNSQSFFGLGNLENLDLSDNKLTDFDIQILDNIGKINSLYLNSNSISNKDEIRMRFNDSEKYVSIY